MAAIAVFVPTTATGAAAVSAAPGDPTVAAMQVGLRNRGVYTGTIDGMPGPATTRAVRRLQRRAGLTPDGVVGPMTRPLLRPFGGPKLGARPLRRGAVGGDVAALQFALAWHGFPSATIDGRLGDHTEAALRRFQRFARLPVDGIAGAATVAALGAPPPRSPYPVAWPLQGPVGDLFGPRGNRFHPGIDMPAVTGAPVAAAAPGRVSFAGYYAGYGYLVVVKHRAGLRSFYAHLSEIDVNLGQEVATGTRIGLVGSTGESTGPHLHFELRLRGAAVDPMPALP